MKKYIFTLSTLIFAGSTLISNAASTEEVPPSNGTDLPPAQVQKNDVPADSTNTGDYLKAQPDENGATNSTSDKHHKKSKSNKESKPTNLEKSKKVTEDPESGGMDLEKK